MAILSDVTLANANYAQTVLYLFLLMLCKVSPFFFLTSFIHLRQICVFALPVPKWQHG